ncbi:DUF2332 domain-containing protein [Nocardioides sp. AE5]|uniref:DUF2332 domain-containing protein n=1 Tax=Nocardioides sp. AE5 TaxID=2962573 RepID=UPI002882ADC0|nr:DUF2332 domain-containing protein [Nocardioides sp. AE5]MDT0203031.1 DUF2332 domain-containing protein [Nocardioides sp. AE5]
MEPFRDVVDSYLGFASEARDSRCFEAWAKAVAEDPEVRSLIATLPAVKQQPNLVFAAARWHGAQAPGPYAGLRSLLVSDWALVRSTILRRSTQTNEVRRLATLVPAFAAITPGPVALLEVGASAGLNLFPDRYSYLWRAADGSARRAGKGPELSCDVRGRMPVPSAVPEIGWRGGIDLNPLDVTDADAMAWLENLVWPEQEERREGLRTAIRIAAAEPPHLRAGDLIEELPGMLEELPNGLTPIVFHSAVIAYLQPPRRVEFHRLMTELVAAGRCHWVSNEAPHVVPEVADGLPVPADPSFLLAIDGRPVGWTHGHGATLTALG